MIDDYRYDCDFSLEEQAEASKKHFEDLEDEYLDKSWATLIFNTYLIVKGGENNDYL